MDKIKKYFDCWVPTENCNFQCKYCYIPTLENFKHKTIKFGYSAEEFKKALTTRRLGGVCMFNICAGGETLLSNEVVPFAKAMLENGHYVMIVTNGSITPKFDEMSNFSQDLRKRLFIKFSYHYLELKRLNLTEVFFNNVKKMKDAGISFTVEVTPNDDYIPYIDEIKRECQEYTGAIPHLTVARVENGDYPIMTKLSREDYIKTWSVFDSELFNFKISVFNEKRKEFCYAGKWSFILSLADGNIKQCYRGMVIQNIFDEMDKPLKEMPVGNNCPEPHCFNSHGFLCFGDIPEINSPYFDEIRNRICSDKSEWLQPEMKGFMHTKLFENNDELTNKDKNKANATVRRKARNEKIKAKIKRIIKKIRKDK